MHSSCRFDSVPLCVVTTSSVLVVTPFVQYACSHGWYGDYKLMKPVDETHSNCRSRVAAGSVVAELSLCLVSLMTMPLLLEAVSIKHWLRRCSSPHLEAREREQLDKRGVCTGSLVLGQDQNCYGGCFNPQSSLNGDLADVRIWNKALAQVSMASQRM